MSEWKLYKLKGFDDLLEAMDRCESNGDLPFSVQNAYDELDFGNIAAPATDAAPENEQAQFERIDIENHNLRRAMQQLMAYLVPVLDEDQFANCESIVNSVGVVPPDNSQAVALNAEQEREAFDVFAKDWWWSEGGDENVEQVAWSTWQARAALSAPSIRRRNEKD